MISILIVDTEKITRDILLRLLEYDLPDATIHITARFESALALCKLFKVNIVITTTSLPPTCSDAMCDVLREIEYDPIKIIIMTTEGRKEELDKLTSLPNTYVVRKPIDMKELTDLILKRIVEIEAIESASQLA